MAYRGIDPDDLEPCCRFCSNCMKVDNTMYQSARKQGIDNMPDYYCYARESECEDNGEWTEDMTEEEIIVKECAIEDIDKECCGDFEWDGDKVDDYIEDDWYAYGDYMYDLMQDREMDEW